MEVLGMQNGAAPGEVLHQVQADSVGRLIFVNDDPGVPADSLHEHLAGLTESGAAGVCRVLESKQIGTASLGGNVLTRDIPLRAVPNRQRRRALSSGGTNAVRSMRRIQARAEGQLRSVLEALASSTLTLQQAQEQTAPVWRQVYEDVRDVGRRASGLAQLGGDPTLYREEEVWFRSAVREELTYWNTFLAEVGLGNVTSEATERRLGSYLKATRFMYEATRVAALPDDVLLYWAGPEDEKRCAGCVYMQARSPFTKDTIPATPRDGMTVCLTNCRHRILVRIPESIGSVFRRRMELPRRTHMVNELKEMRREKSRKRAMQIALGVPPRERETRNLRPPRETVRTSQRGRNPFRGERITAPPPQQPFTRRGRRVRVTPGGFIRESLDEVKVAEPITRDTTGTDLFREVSRLFELTVDDTGNIWIDPQGGGSLTRVPLSWSPAQRRYLTKLVKHEKGRASRMRKILAKFPALRESLLEALLALDAVCESLSESRSLPRLVRKSAGSGPAGHPEARQRGQEIWVFPKFFALPDASRRHVLAHELGHWFRQENVSLSDIMGWEPGDKYLGVFATFDSEEGFAEAFAVYLLNPPELKRKYPALYTDMLSHVRGQGSALRRWVDTTHATLGEAKHKRPNPARRAKKIAKIQVRGKDKISKANQRYQEKLARIEQGTQDAMKKAALGEAGAITGPPSGDIVDVGAAGKAFEAAFITGLKMLGLSYKENRATGALWDIRMEGPGWNRIIKDRDTNLKVHSTRWLFSDSATYHAATKAHRMVKRGTITPTQADARVANAIRKSLNKKGLASAAFMKPHSIAVQSGIVAAARSGDKEKMRALLRAKNFSTKRFGRYKVSVDIKWESESWEQTGFIRIDGGTSGKKMGATGRARKIGGIWTLAFRDRSAAAKKPHHAARTAKESVEEDTMALARASLGIPRTSMPQIATAQVPAFLAWLSKQGVRHRRDRIAAGRLHPTQNEFNSAKIDKWAGIPTSVRSKKPVLVSKDSYVLDGHHRWAGILKDDPSELVTVVVIDAPIRRLLKLALAFPGRGAAKTATEDAEGTLHDPSLKVAVKRAGFDSVDQARAVVRAFSDRKRAGKMPKRLRRKLSGSPGQRDGEGIDLLIDRRAPVNEGVSATWDSVPYASMRIQDVARLFDGATRSSTLNTPTILKILDRLIGSLEFSMMAAIGRPEANRASALIRGGLDRLTQRFTLRESSDDLVYALARLEALVE